MQITQQVFENFLTKSVNLSPEHISSGSTSHTYVRGLLQNKAGRDPSFPWMIDGDFLSGSYARGTKIYPLDDIDVIMVLDGHGLHPIENGMYLSAGVRGSGTSGSPVGNYTDAYGLISSKRIMELFHGALKETYPNSTIRKNGQAVNIWLESKKMGIDIVPAFHIQPHNGTQDYYYIPAGNDRTDWIKTNPKIDQAICDALDLRHDKKLKPVIKLLKHWNHFHNSGRLESYHLEAVTWYVFNLHPDKIMDYGTAVKYFFDNAAPYFTQPCLDPTRLGGPIDQYLSQADRLLTLSKIEEAKRALQTAMMSRIIPTRQGERGHWQQLLGNAFGA